jgi:MSHA biogenesis protein MshO
LRGALPNSVRLANGASGPCMEMLATRAGGRYRAETDGNGNGNILDFTIADSSFDMFGSFSNLPGQAPVANSDQVVVYNLGSSSPGADAYAGNNTATIASVVFPDPTPGAPAGETLITLTTPTRFPLASPGNRFQVISGPTSYVCSGIGTDALGNGTGTLSRTVGYAIAGGQSCPPVGGTQTLLANNVSNCQFTYQQAGGNPTAREGLMQMQLGVQQVNELVNLYHEVHVSNVP